MRQLAKPLVIPPKPDQAPWSYASQMAFRVGRAANEFCLDMGMSFQAIVDGEPEAVRTLEEVCGLETGFFDPCTLRKVGERQFELGRISVPREMLSRTNLRACPSCLLEDVAGKYGQDGVYARFDWMFSPVRRCSRHEQILVPLPAPSGSIGTHDLSAHLHAVSSFWMKAPHERCGASDLGIYVAQVLAQRSEETAPFGLPLYSVARLSETLGLSLLRPSVGSTGSLTELQLHQAGHTGFQAIKGGADSFMGLMRVLHERSTKESQNLSLKGTLGPLYELLVRNKRATEFDPIRRLVRDYLVEHTPLGEGDFVFGVAVEKRQLHSVRSASLETGLHPKRLRKLLMAAGIASPDDGSRKDDDIVFSADAAAPFLRKISTALSLGEAAAYLNLPRPHDRMLAKAGVIRSLVPMDAPGVGDGCFDKAELDAFLDDLTKWAPSQPSDLNGFASIPKAAKRACCSSLEIVSLIISGRIAARIDPRERGFLSVLVDPEEIKPLVRLPDPAGVNLREAERRLGTSTSVIKALVENRLLASHQERNPVNRAISTYIAEEVLEEFDRTYVSLHRLSAETGIHFKRLSADLVHAGVPLAFNRDKVPANFYRRAEVALIVAGQLSAAAK